MPSPNDHEIVEAVGSALLCWLLVYLGVAGAGWVARLIGVPG